MVEYSLTCEVTVPRGFRPSFFSCLALTSTLQFRSMFQLNPPLIALRLVPRSTSWKSGTSLAMMLLTVACCAAVGGVTTPATFEGARPVNGDSARKLMALPLTCGTMGFTQLSGSVSVSVPAPRYGVW